MTEQATQTQTINVQWLLEYLVKHGGSDLHLSANSPPMVRISGHMVAVKDIPPMKPAVTKQLCYSILTDNQKRKFEENNELDFSFGLKGLSRFRGNIFMQRGSVAGVFRVIPYKILSFKDLGLPQSVADLAKRPRGLVLVTGPTGSGKSTTLAAIIDAINASRQEHIITIEDPIEFMHQNKNCLVNQREVGSDTFTFKNAIKSVLRQDPDIVLVGELRDLETIEAALTIAETGHLCFGTLHTNSCVQTINRVVDVFPTNQQAQIRTQLSFVLEGVLSQTLIPRMDGKGRAMALEVMIPNPAIRNLIREDKIHQIYSQMQMGQDKYGMQTMNQSLLNLYHRKLIDRESAIVRSSDIEEMKQLMANPAAASRKPR